MNMDEALDVVLYGNTVTEVVHRLREGYVATTRCGLETYPLMPQLPMLQLSPGLYLKPVGKRMAVIKWRYCRRCWSTQDEHGIPLEFKEAT
jgi:hypothetical protein